MPYINSASIQSGQIIQANHVLNVINTFNDTATTDIKMKGTASFNEVNIANLRVTGTASIDVFVTTYYSSSIIYASGSTKFGDSADDTHQYTGSLGVTGTLRVGQGITGSLLGVASSATSASFAATASYALNAGVFTGSFATTGSNTFRGAQAFTGSIRLLGDQTITGSLTVSGSSTLTNIGPMVLVGSLVARGGDNVAYLSADRSVTTIITNTPFPTTASFVLDEFSGGSEPSIGSVAGGSYEWTTSFLAYYAGVSGSGETQLSDSANAIAPGPPPIGDPGVTQIQIGIFSASLAPSGSIQSYKVYINSGSSWYVKSGVAAFATTAIVLSGNTSTNFITDITSAGFSTTTSPVGNVNTIIYNSQSISTAATSSVAMNAPVTVTGSLLVTQNITGNLIGSASSALSSSFTTTASFATTASFVNRSVSSSFATTASFANRSVSSSFATTASYALNGGGGNISTGSFATTGSNTFRGNQVISGAVDLTGVLTVQNSITTPAGQYFVVSSDTSTEMSWQIPFAPSIAVNAGIFTGASGVTIGNTSTDSNGNALPTKNWTFGHNGNLTAPGGIVARGTFAVIGEDGNVFISASRIISSSVSSSINTTSPTFVGTTFVNTNVGGFTWDSNFDVYYSGVSGSGETQLSSVYNAVGDSNNYNSFVIGANTRPQITLSPSGSISTYKLYIYNIPNSTWYAKTGLTDTALDTGVTVNLSGPTSTQLVSDLSNAGFNSVSDPSSNVNTINYTQQFTFAATQSAIILNSPRIHPTSSGTPNFTGSDGQFIFGSTGGNHYMYVWMNNAWRSSSLV